MIVFTVTKLTERVDSAVLDHLGAFHTLNQANDAVNTAAGEELRVSYAVGDSWNYESGDDTYTICRFKVPKAVFAE